MAFVHNSAKSKPPVPLKRDLSNNDLFEIDEACGEGQISAGLLSRKAPQVYGG